MSANALVLTMVSDLMFQSRIKSVLQLSGHVYRAYSDREDISAQTGVTGMDALPPVGLVDLTDRGGDPIRAISRMRETDMPVIAFCGHTDAEAREAARAAGATLITARSEINESLPLVIERALEWEADPDCDFC